MRNVALSLTAVAGFLLATAVQAECTRPRPSFQIPEGASASQEELAAAKEALVKFDQVVGEYLRCIEGEASQKLVGKDNATRQRMNVEYINTYNSAADELAGLGACYNAQVKAATAKPAAAATPASGAAPAAGAAKKTANCSTFIKDAANRKVTAPDPSAPGIVKESDGYTTELSDGAWSFTLLRDERPRICGNTQCQQRIVLIRNSSPKALECTASITYEGADVAGRKRVEGKAVVNGQSARAVITGASARDVNAETFDAQCKQRADLPPLATPANCKYEVIKPISISDYYPDESRKRGDEGPVVVEFSVGNKPAGPSDVKVVASSLFPELDAAAAKAVQAMVMSSSCATGRYRLRLSFQLQ